jgi:hypothetical protein
MHTKDQEESLVLGRRESQFELVSAQANDDRALSRKTGKHYVALGDCVSTLGSALAYVKA